jgi:hypothetical protein
MNDNKFQVPVEELLIKIGSLVIENELLARELRKLKQVQNDKPKAEVVK